MDAKIRLSDAPFRDARYAPRQLQVEERPGGERVLRAGDPCGEFQAALLFRFIHSHGKGAHNREGIRGDDLAFLHRFAAVEAVGFVRLAEGADPSGFCAIEHGHAIPDIRKV